MFVIEKANKKQNQKKALRACRLSDFSKNGQKKVLMRLSQTTIFLKFFTRLPTTNQKVEKNVAKMAHFLPFLPFFSTFFYFFSKIFLIFLANFRDFL
jgi:hypothetical protein